MKTRKVPMRMCVVTRERYHKKDLIRVVRNKDGEVFVDKTEAGKENGKGCYLKRDLEVINVAKQNRILDRVLEINVSDAIYDELSNIINGVEEEKEKKLIK